MWKFQNLSVHLVYVVCTNNIDKEEIRESDAAFIFKKYQHIPKHSDDLYFSDFRSLFLFKLWPVIEKYFHS